MKVFFMNDCEWWAGPDEASVKRAAADAWASPEYDVEADPDEYFVEMEELSEGEMDRLQFAEDLSNPNSGKCSFREKLNDMLADPQEEFPCFFAGTEW